MGKKTTNTPQEEIAALEFSTPETVVYVLQIMARHGVGTQGWRTVRRSSGGPYYFQTHAAALAALRKHFPALREEHNVRVHTLSQSLGG